MKIYKYLLAALLAATCMMPAEALVLEGVAGGRNVSATMLSGNIEIGRASCRERV